MIGTQMSDSSQSTPLRVLHVLGVLNPGGIETWLLHLARCADRSQLAMDFLVHEKIAGTYDAELLALGARIHVSSLPDHPLLHARDIRRALRVTGPYDVVPPHPPLHTPCVFSTPAIPR